MRHAYSKILSLPIVNLEAKTTEISTESFFIGYVDNAE